MLSYHMQGIIATIMLLYDDNLFIISLKKDASCVNIKSFLVRQRNKTSIKCLFYFYGKNKYGFYSVKSKFAASTRGLASRL